MSRKEILVKEILELGESEIIDIIKLCSKELDISSLTVVDKFISRQVIKKKKLHRCNEEVIGISTIHKEYERKRSECSNEHERKRSEFSNEHERKRSQFSYEHERKRSERSNEQIVKDPIERSAWKSPMIFRGDEVPTKGNLFIDVEKVSLKIRPLEKKHELVAATVAIVNENRTLVLWSYISWPKHIICQYFSSITNLGRGSLEQGFPIEIIHSVLDKCLPGNKLIGVNINEDLKSLRYRHVDTEDLQNYFKDNNKQPYSLKALAIDLLGKSKFQEDSHSAIQDARVTRDLFRLKEDLAIRDAMEFEIERPARTPYSYDPTDRCFCKYRK